MADVSKAEKLAAARKKLKQYQQRNREGPGNNGLSTPSSNHSPTPLENIANKKAVNVPDEIPSYSLPPKSDNKSEVIIQSNGTGNAENITLFSFKSNPTNNNDIFDSISQSPPANNNVENVQQREDEHVIFTEHRPIESDVVSPPHSNFSNNVPSPSTDFTVNEKYLQRINELDAQLAFERRTSEELQRKLADSHGHILSLQHEIKRLHDVQKEKVSNEVLQLEERLKIQLQTIEILVSEKSELQKELSTLQEASKENKDKCEELASRLKASRSQVQKLERDLTDRSENKSQHNGILKKLEEELKQKEYIILETSHKLAESKNEVRELEKRVEMGLKGQEDLRRQLQEKENLYSMAQLKLAQLGGDSDSSSLVEVEHLKAEVDKWKKESDNAKEEHKKSELELRQYISNMNEQLLQANAKCERAENDRDELKKQIESLIKHLSDLEKDLQREKATRERADEPEAVKELRDEVVKLKQELTSKEQQIVELEDNLSKANEKLLEAERWRAEVPDMNLLQAAMESDRVAAARALQQNNTLKEKLHQLEEHIIKLNNGKLELTEELDKYRHMAGEFRLQLEKYKSRQEMRMVDSVTQTNPVRKDTSESQTTIEDIVQNAEPQQPVSVETLLMIEDKLKKTMNRIADLSDEKQRLEHLVLQLQSETETIGEYVTLYQNQRSLLKEKEDEKEREMALIVSERVQLKQKLNQINALLTKFPHNPDVENTTCKISSLLSEIQSSSIVQESSGPPPSFHPCLLCSGKLLTV